MTNDYPADIFRAYDIRGHATLTLSSALYEALGRSIGTQHVRLGGSHVYLGFDGRLSSPNFAVALRKGLCAAGAQVINLGLVPTAVVYHAAAQEPLASAVIVTASHNPAEDNGLKYHLLGTTQTPDDIQALYQQTRRHDWLSGIGSTQLLDYLPRYVDDIVQKIKLKRSLHLVIDTGHGVAGIVARTLFESLGCRVEMLYEQVDGHFPAHHPDPSQPENLTDLQASVLAHQADLGLAFDGDGDRLGVVAEDGRIIWPDELMLLFATQLLTEYPGGHIVFDVKSSRRLAPAIIAAGGVPVMWKTGHSFLRLKLQEQQALLAGELSGHIFFQDRWYGFDDGLYAGARLVELLSQQRTTLTARLAVYPQSVSTPEIKIPIADIDKARIMADIIHAAQMHLSADSINLLDGLRIDYPDGFGLIRASQTTPHLTLRFEADTLTRLAEIKQTLLQLLPSSMQKTVSLA